MCLRLFGLRVLECLVLIACVFFFLPHGFFCFGVIALLHTDSVLGVSLSGSRFGCCIILWLPFTMFGGGDPVSRVCFPALISDFPFAVSSHTVMCTCCHAFLTCVFLLAFLIQVMLLALGFMLSWQVLLLWCDLFWHFGDVCCFMYCPVGNLPRVRVAGFLVSLASCSLYHVSVPCGY